MVSIRAPLRRATWLQRMRRPSESVSIRAPLRRATLLPRKRLGRMEFQSAPPCGERPANQPLIVSERLFQSAPPCGERPAVFATSSPADAFQSAPPCGERHRGGGPAGLLDVVSIRAPLRRATAEALRLPGSSNGFNPRPPAESDPWRLVRAGSFHRFNPRPPAESDSRGSCAPQRGRVSIRAPLRRATRVVLAERHAGLFQSAPPCGERRATPTVPPSS